MRLLSEGESIKSELETEKQQIGKGSPEGNSEYSQQKGDGVKTNQWTQTETRLIYAKNS